MGGNRPEKIADGVVYAEVSEQAGGSGILYITGTGRLYVLGYDLLSGEVYRQAEAIADGICAVSSCSSHILGLGRYRCPLRSTTRGGWGGSHPHF